MIHCGKKIQILLAKCDEGRAIAFPVEAEKNDSNSPDRDNNLAEQSHHSPELLHNPPAHSSQPGNQLEICKVDAPLHEHSLQPLRTPQATGKYSSCVSSMLLRRMSRFHISGTLFSSKRLSIPNRLCESTSSSSSTATLPRAAKRDCLTTG